MAQFRTDIKKIDSSQILSRYEVVGLMENISPSGSLIDSYGRFRTSSQYQLFTSQNVGARQYKFDEKVIGTASITYSANESSTLMTVGTALGDEAIRESIHVVPFQPGKSTQIMTSFAFSTPKENLRQRAGYFDEKNGVYFENLSGINYFVVRSFSSGTVVETKIPQSNWNFDKFDGTGYSSQSHRTSVILDPKNVNTFWADTASFASRNIRIGFIFNGRPYTAHIWNTDFSGEIVTLQTLTLPFRFEIKNIGITSSSSTMKQVNCAASSEGGFQLTGISDGVSRGYTIADATTLSSAGTEYPLIAYRLKSTRRNNVVIPNKFHIYILILMQPSLIEYGLMLYQPAEHGKQIIQ